MSETRHLPLRLERPPRGGGFRLQWLAADWALVLRGEPLCEAFGEDDPEPVRLLSPTAGYLHRLVPDNDRVPPTAILAELECGPEWDEEIRLNATVARTELRERLSASRSDLWLESFVRHRLADMRVLTLECDLRHFENRTDRSSRQPLTIRPLRPQRVAAALLASLREDTSPSLSPHLSSATRREMASVAERLRRKFSLKDRSDWFVPPPAPAPPDPPPALRWMQAVDELERSYDAQIAACAQRIADFPPELQAAKLKLWRDLKELELRRLSGEDG